MTDVTASYDSASYLAATRTSYDTIAAECHRRWAGELAKNPFERAMLDAFAELARGRGPVADVGCGTGRVTEYLAARGLDAFGIDLSPGMLAIARANNPDLRFIEGSMTALDLEDASVGALLAWYSTIHVPWDDLPGVFAEFHRVLTPGAPLLVSFQIGDAPLHMTEAWGHTFDLVFHRRTPQAMADLLSGAGFEERARLVRRAETEGASPERTDQAFLTFRKPNAAATTGT
ncbi:class I SAM-dependent methyltransferase [Streptomyces indicus]|uniref:Methyltransferase domain-containing protein n=1 Tax=Streptomyces indicus TaxID=417292 RepID=A0A1G8ZW71_9ACTN|nr:class I SAM-dependent methyltransferase [Streptomyces indicus]SDK19366.1 Methyltransferase domain-containing protein [Streptomyces indicus]